MFKRTSFEITPEQKEAGIKFRQKERESQKWKGKQYSKFPSQHVMNMFWKTSGVQLEDRPGLLTPEIVKRLAKLEGGKLDEQDKEYIVWLEMMEEKKKAPGSFFISDELINSIGPEKMSKKQANDLVKKA